MTKQARSQLCRLTEPEGSKVQSQCSSRPVAPVPIGFEAPSKEQSRMLRRSRGNLNAEAGFEVAGPAYNPEEAPSSGDRKASLFRPRVIPMLSIWPWLACLPTTDAKKVSAMKRAADLKKSTAVEGLLDEKSSVKSLESGKESSPTSSSETGLEHAKKSSAVNEEVKKSKLEELKEIRAAKRASALKRVEEAKRAFAERLTEHHERRLQDHAKKASAARVADEKVKLIDSRIPVAVTNEDDHVTAMAGRKRPENVKPMEFQRHRETVDKMVMEELKSPKMAEALKSPKGMPDEPQLDKVGSGKVREPSRMNSMLKRALYQQGRKQHLDGDGDADKPEKRKEMKRTRFSSAANVVKRLIQLANLVRMNHLEAHLRVLVGIRLGKESLPQSSDTEVSSSWDIAVANNFDVRGKSYLCDKGKVAAGEPLLKFIAAHWIKSDRREDNLAGRPGSIVQILGERLKEIPGYRPYFFVINLQVPGTTTHTLALYYVTYKSLEEDSLLHQFVHGDDEFRNARFKLIPRVTQGSWLVKRTVGSTPCLIGKALTVSYHKGESYIELDIDIGSSSVAKGVVGVVFGYLRHLVVEMGFLIQAENEEHLPERLLGTCRVSQLDVNKAVSVERKP